MQRNKVMERLRQLGQPGAGGWDGSTLDPQEAHAAAEEVVKTQLAGVFLADNPDLKGVHSLQSVKTLLGRKEQKAAAVGVCAVEG
jgi:hypothetical protein